MATLVCVPIMVEGVEAALADTEAARDAGAEMVELRIDQVFSGAKGRPGEEETRRVVKVVSGSKLPCIVTCRSSAEGGHYDGDDEARIALYERLGKASGTGEHPPRYIDVEMATYARSANLRMKVDLATGGDTGLILSMHDFQGRPADLLRRLAQMRAEPRAAVLKIAYFARSLRDNLELFDILSESERPTIALGMGEFGLMSRVLAPKFGGFLTFASLRPEGATAPGQPTIAQLLDFYGFREIGARTRVYGVIGYPVEHSISPAVHNAAFDAQRIDAIYLPLPVPPEYEHFKATLGALIDHPRLDFSGCSVTIPHKEHLVRFALEEKAHGRGRWSIDSRSEACGAANTLVVARDEKGLVCRVLNTDGAAGAGALNEVMVELNRRRVGIVGAGGVAKGVALELLAAGCEVVLYNRTAEKARRLAAELDERKPAGTNRWEIGAAELGAMGAETCDAYINCTPVGMRGGPAPNESPIPAEFLRSLPAGTIVMDTVYAPKETPLLREARAAGLKTIDGLAMFFRQAVPQFEAWTGQTAPSALMHQVAHKAVFHVEKG